MAPFIKDRRHLIGLIFLFVGIVLILDNIRFLPHIIPWWVWSWQFLLITIGTFSLLTSDNRRPGIILISIGSVFLVSDLLPNVWPGFFNWFIDDTNLFWYLVLIVVGAVMLLRGKKPSSSPRARHSRRPGAGNTEGNGGFSFSGSDGDDYIDEVAIFGGGKKIITSENFKGGKMTSIFGGMELNLSQSKLAEGNVELEVFAMFGGWTLVVPPHWQVKSEVIAIFGGIGDKRMISSDQMRDNTRQLVIKGIVMFGGGEIKSY